VLDTGNNVIDKFSAAGVYLGQLTGTPGGVFSGTPLTGVAVDGNGNLWVAQASGEVDEFASDPANSFVTSWNTNQGASPGFAVSPSDSVYAVTGCGCVERFSGGGSDLGQLDGGPATGVAVDPQTGNVFVDDRAHIAEYEASGTPLPPAFGAGVLAGGAGVAFDDANGRLYVADGVANQVDVFGLVTLPDATTQPATAITGASATLNGTIDPAGGPEAQCEFEYGTDTSYGHSVPCEPAGPFTGPEAVHADITGLAKATIYHYRLYATSVEGVNNGADRSFTTARAPTIVSNGENEVGTWAVEVSYTTATIKATIDPNGAATTYRFEYGPTMSYGASIPSPDGEIGSGEVSQRLTSLQAGTTYHYRVVATNAEGTTDGPDETFVTFPAASPAGADTCPNAAFRVGLSALLPDCRAYEMVSPPDKNGGDVLSGEPDLFAAADSGERATYFSGTSFGAVQGSGNGGMTQYLGVRGPSGWQTHGVTPTPSLNTPTQAFLGKTQLLAFSDELDRAVVQGYSLPGVNGAVPDLQNLYLENTLATTLLEPITRFEGPEEPIFGYSVWASFGGYQEGVGGGSGDLSVTTFVSRANLVAPATGSAPKVYALDHGTAHLVGILPGGAVPAEGSQLARLDNNYAMKYPTITYKDTVSRDGSRILFVSPASQSEGQLYMRKNESETVNVSESETSTPTEAANVRFQAATPDLKEVLFTTTSQLLDSDPGGSGIALYLYTDSANPESESNLSLIARFPGADDGGDEHEYVRGISDDGSRIYFANGDGEMLLWENGQVKKVAPVPGVAGALLMRQGYHLGDLGASVSADGRRIAFMNPGALTANASNLRYINVESYPNTNMYVYEQDGEKLTCVSCPSTGARTTTGIETNVRAGPTTNGVSLSVQPRFFSQDGNYAFFNTAEALLPQDTNGVTDAYEYNVETGRLSLLSSGTGGTGTWFVEASPSGSDVFLATRQKLDKWDPDNLVDVYDARVDGGFPEPPVPPAPCSGDECQGVPGAVPSFNTASSFNGLGNAAPPPTVTVKARKPARTQLLTRALKRCRSERGRPRIACEKAARRRYAPTSNRKRTRRG
jgi:hypothetical protein